MRVAYIQAHKLIQANSVLPRQHFEEITAWKDMLVRGDEHSYKECADLPQTAS
jgi:hypothetical protein